MDASSILSSPDLLAVVAAATGLKSCGAALGTAAGATLPPSLPSSTNRLDSTAIGNALTSLLKAQETQNLLLNNIQQIDPNVLLNFLALTSNLKFPALGGHFNPASLTSGTTTQRYNPSALFAQKLAYAPVQQQQQQQQHVDEADEAVGAVNFTPTLASLLATSNGIGNTTIPAQTLQQLVASQQIARQSEHFPPPLHNLLFSNVPAAESVIANGGNSTEEQEQKQYEAHSRRAQSPPPSKAAKKRRLSFDIDQALTTPIENGGGQLPTSQIQITEQPILQQLAALAPISATFSSSAHSDQTPTTTTTTIASTSAQNSPSAGSATTTTRRLSFLSSISNVSSCSASASTSSFSGRQQHLSTTPQRKPPAPIPLEKKDEAYYERRRKNNDAAKRSRDFRRQKEEQTARRAESLEQENLQLKMQIDHLRKELARLEAIVAPGNNKIPFPTTPIKPFLPTTTMKNGLDELLEQHLQRKMNGGVNIMVVSPTSTVQDIVCGTPQHQQQGNGVEGDGKLIRTNYENHEDVSISGYARRKGTNLLPKLLALTKEEDNMKNTTTEVDDAVVGSETTLNIETNGHIENAIPHENSS